MRYAAGGGLTAEARSRRERTRLQASQKFEQDMDAGQVAGLLRVSTKSVYQWRRAWMAGGDAALASKGPGGTGCELGEAQLSRLQAALNAGPAAYGWDKDRRWTLAQVAELIQRLFGVPCTLRGVSYLLHATASPRAIRQVCHLDAGALPLAKGGSPWTRAGLQQLPESQEQSSEIFTVWLACT